MVSPRQKQYLDAMGVPVWQLRQPLPGEVAEVVVEQTAPVVEPVVEQAAPTSAPVATPSSSSIDVIDLDWPALQSCVQGCTACDLHQGRSQTVFGVGDQNSSWMFVGEAPGEEEDQHGAPFVGRAGQLLTSMLRALKMSREQVYITNVLKCRPPENREPHVDEVRQCSHYLQREIALVQPKVIVALGHVAAQALLENSASVAEMRDQLHRYGEQQIPLVVTYHPAYLMRSPQDKRLAWQDLCRAKQVVKSSA